MPGLTPLTYQILLALADGDRHGYGIIKEIEQRCWKLVGAGKAHETALPLDLRRNDLFHQPPARPNLNQLADFRLPLRK